MMNVTINDDDDDDAEGQNARGCTIQRSGGGDTTESIALEDNEIIKNCLEIHQGNKLSHENIWSFSLIDRLDTLLDTNHKSLNNFSIAGSVLEASSKVYSLRVDSLHSDVLRMRARLNAKKFDEKRIENDDDDDDDNDAEAIAGEGSNDSVMIAVASEQVPVNKNVKKAKSGRSRCRVITNKETLNARLDTVLLQDPVLAKVNSIVGSITAPHRLMNNILLTTNSGLKLCNNFPFWNSTTLQDCDYTEEFHFNSGNETEWAAYEGLSEITKKSENLKLRSLIGGYTITNTPAPTNDDNEFCWGYDGWCNVYNYGERGGDDADMTNLHDMSMTFDMNSDSEPVPVVREQTHSLDVDYGELVDLTADEHTAINNCQGLRRASVIIEDLRPVDASCHLEYSYRPSDKISKFWAGPSHWKFKGTHTRQHSEVSINHRARCKRRTLHKQKSKQLRFGEFHDGCFIKLNQFKKPRGDIRKKWDEKKLKLPVDMQLPPDLFQHYLLAPDTVIHENENDTNVAENDVDSPEQHHVIDNNGASVNNLNNDFDMDNEPNTQADNTVLEIPTTLEGAPIQVPPILVPFARQAKVVDMKNLKSSCFKLLNQQLQRPSTQTKDVQYSQSVTSFQGIYKDLPQLLTQNNKKTLSPSLAFLSILHSASELPLRLTPHEDLKDFTIRKIDG